MQSLYISGQGRVHDLIPALPFCHSSIKARKPKDPAYPDELRTIGDHVRARRLDLGLYQKDVAKRIGVTTDTITNWEKGRSNPDLRATPKVLEFLGYDPREEELTLGNQLRRHRQAFGLSQAESARMTGVHPSTLAKWERGKRTPKGLYLGLVGRLLNEAIDTDDRRSSESSRS